ncbi:MAG: glutathione S-transferase family protein, partial [Pseudomonadota bacterium]
DSQALRAARANIRYHLQYIGWLAATRNWLAGPRMSQADLAMAAALSVLDYLGEVDWSKDEALKDWYARLKSRPAFRPLLADRLRGMPPVSHYVDLDF